MTVSSTLDRQYFDGNGLNKTFPFDFVFFQNTQIYVNLIDEDGADGAIGAITGLTETIDYTLTGARSSNGGKVVLNNAPLPGQRILVQRILPQIQPTSFRNQGAFFPQIHEDAFDRLTMLVQQSLSDVGNSLQLDRPGLRWDFEGKRGINAADPVNNTDVATKGWIGKYVDTVSGLINTTLGIAYDAGNLFDYFRLGVSRSVDNIAALRGLATTRNQRAFVFGYYTRGDGGGGSYSIDPTDTTSADNGGTVIVSTDGGRWKLSQLGKLSSRQFGAKGDGINADNVPIQRALDTGRLIYNPAAQYKFLAPVTTVQGGGLEGDGEKTQFIRGFTGGPMVRHPGGNQLGSPIILRDFCITTANGITVNSGDTGIDIGYAEKWAGRGDIANLVILKQWDGFKWKGGTLNTIHNVQCLEGKGHGFLAIDGRGELSNCLAQFNKGNGYFFYAQTQGETGVQMSKCGTFANQGWGFLFDAAPGVYGANILLISVSASADGAGGFGFVKKYYQVWIVLGLSEQPAPPGTFYPGLTHRDDAPGFYMAGGDGCEEIKMSDMHILNCRGVGAYFDSTKNLLTSDMRIVGCGRGGLGVGQQAGLYMANGNKGCKMIGLSAKDGDMQTTDIIIDPNGANEIDFVNPSFRTTSGGGTKIKSIGDTTSASADVTVDSNSLQVPWYGALFQVVGAAGFNVIPPSPKDRKITLLFDSAVTISTTGNIKLPAPMTTTPGTTLTLICNGNNWYAA